MSDFRDEQPAGIIVVDADGEIGWVNAAFTRLVGRRVEDLRGSSMIGRMAACGARLAALDALRGLINGSRRGILEAEIAGADGAARWLSISVAPQSRDAAGVTLVCYDVTRYRDDKPRPRRTPIATDPVSPPAPTTNEEIEAELVPPARILLAEDNRSNRMLALAVLQNVGYRVDSVVDGTEVIGALEHTSYDLVLMDIQMPTLDGFQATAIIRRLAGDASRIPVIAVTAHAQRGSREACLAAGMDDYLSKPYTPAALLDIVARWLRKATSDFEAPGALISLAGAATGDRAMADGDWPPAPPMSRMRDAINDGDIDALQRAAREAGTD
jgi:PAS domain S-box-containing protein